MRVENLYFEQVPVVRNWLGCQVCWLGALFFWNPQAIDLGWFLNNANSISSMLAHIYKSILVGGMIYHLHSKWEQIH